jgi:hypothetical protein
MPMIVQPPDLASASVLSNFQSHITVDPSLVGGSTPTRTEFAIPFEQLSVFTRAYESSAPLQNLPLYAMAEIGILPAPKPPALPPTPGGRAPLPTSEVFVSYPLGLLGTNHAGYASFDLTVLRTSDTIDAFQRSQANLGQVPIEGTVQTIGLRRLLVFPFADPILAIDALQRGDIGLKVVVLQIELDDIQLSGRLMDRPMVAMQNPNILDWRLSPGSFTLSGSVLIGEDGCETLLPSNLSTSQFRFRQVARRSGDAIREEATAFRLGNVLDYATEWFSVGHSLGQLIYSLPLAPGEVVKMALVDWSRADAGSRSEDTGFSESLVHDQVRDRSLSETVQSALTEWQSGHSFMAGAAASAAGAVSGVGLGLTAALGGATSTSEGTRNLTASTTQKISDAFHQASTDVRELRSTVVVQSTQSEKSNLQTRVVANY